MEIWESKLWGIICWPLSILYRLSIKLRKYLYDLNVLSVVHLDAKIISVGNITVGGTGKTPMVERLARLLMENGYNIAVLSRGYRRKKKNTMIVSDRNGLKATPEEAGDEPILLAKKLPGIPVVVGRNRRETGKKAAEMWKCDVLILDDGFQYMGLKKDLDLVLIDSQNPWGNGKLLPAGPLREPLSELKRAHAVVFTRVNENRNIKASMQRVQEIISAPIFHSVHQPSTWVSLSKGDNFPLNFLKGKKVVAFAGIGNPDSFEKSLTEIGVETVDFIRYRDHYWYKQKDLDQLTLMAEQKGAMALVTTEKDGVRLPLLGKYKTPIYLLQITLGIKAINKFKKLIDSVLKAPSREKEKPDGKEKNHGSRR